MKTPMLMVIGLDSIPMEIVDKYASNRTAPTLKSLMESGASGRAMPDFPPYTPNNWAVIATGASSSITGAVNWYKIVDGEYMSTFDSRAIDCDSIFKAAAKQNLTTLAIHYPGAYPPPDSERNIVLVPLDKGLVSYAMYAGKTININIKEGKTPVNILGDDEVELSTRGIAALTSLLAKFVGATEDSASIMERDLVKQQRESVIWEAQLVEENGFPTKVIFTTDKGEQKVISLNLWSRFFTIDAPTSIGKIKGGFRLKVKYEHREGKLCIVRSEIYMISAIASVPDLTEDLFNNLGGFFEHSFFAPLLKNIEAPDFDEILRKTVDELEYQVDWMSDAAKHVLDTQGWDILYLHWHWPDNVLHYFLQYYDPSAPGYTPEKAPRAEKALEETLRLCDRLVKGLLQCAGPNTTVCVVSDHGNAPNHYAVNVNKRLEEAGLLVRDDTGKIDYTKSMAFRTSVAAYSILINTEDKGGPIKKCDYEKVQERVIDTLLDWKTEDGKRVMALALKRKDGALLNYWGQTKGDVFFHCNPGFYWLGNELCTPVSEGANHGSQMPATFTDHTSNMAFFIIVGPKIKNEFRWDEDAMGPFRLIDLVPTLCKAIGIEAPLDVTGSPKNKIFINKIINKKE